MNETIPAGLLAVLTTTPELQRAFLVGGCVRDWILGEPSKDYDIEVFGISYEQLAATLARHGRTDLVGRSFGVIKLTLPGGETHDFAIPRRDSKVRPGHKGFEVHFDPDITLEEAAARRDFTLNALMYDPRRREVLDFFGGRNDLEQRVLRHTSPAFTEDPLRVLRGMQFASRFDLTPAPETVALCRTIQNSHDELAGDRIREEWFKWAEKSRVPSRGLRFLVETGWDRHYPEIQALVGTPQDPEWHPEGDVFVHTCHCLDALVTVPAWLEAERETRIVLTLAVLGHDFAKPQTTHVAVRHEQLRIVSPGHEAAGGDVTARFLDRIRTPLAIRERVVPLVMNHLAHMHMQTDRMVRRLSKRLEPATITELIVVITADQFGRPPRPRALTENVLELQKRATDLQVQFHAPDPILLGRHLIEKGMKPGPEFSVILSAAYEAQLEGQFFTLHEAWRWLAAEAALPVPDAVREKLPAAGTAAN